MEYQIESLYCQYIKAVKKSNLTLSYTSLPNQEGLSGGDSWVDIKLCHWVPKVPFVMRRIDFTIVYFYLKYESKVLNSQQW